MPQHNDDVDNDRSPCQDTEERAIDDMRVLWVHNYPPDIVSSGVFMFSLLDEMRTLGLEIDEHYTGGLRSPLALVKQAKEVARLSRRYDLVHAQWGSACGLVASFAKSRKILSLRGTDLLGMSCGNVTQRLHGTACRWFTGSSVNKFDAIIVMSNRMHQDLRVVYDPGGSVSVLPDGIDLELFRPMERREARRRLGEESNEASWVLFSTVLGMSNPVKRPALAEDAFARVQRALPNVEMRVLEDQPHDRVPLWVNASDVVLLTSVREGWPNIIKEALACNVPFVSTDVSDLREIADRESLCKVVAADPDAIASAVLAVLQEPRGNRLRQYVAEMELRSIARETLKLYEEVLTR